MEFQEACDALQAEVEQEHWAHADLLHGPWSVEEVERLLERVRDEYEDVTEEESSFEEAEAPKAPEASETEPPEAEAPKVDRELDKLQKNEKVEVREV